MINYKPGGDGNENDQQALAQAKEFATDALNTVNQTSGIARGIYLSFIALTTYLAVTLLNTNDDDLFLFTPLELPIVKIGVDLKGFYSLSPWLYLFMHLNMLLIFAVLARKLHDFENKIAPLPYPQRQALRKQLHPFSLTQSISADNKGLLGHILRFVSWFIAGIIPITLLLWIQLDFLPAQEQGVTWSQRWAIAIDALFTLYFWGRVMRERRLSLRPKNWRPKKILGIIPKEDIVLFSYVFLAFYVSFFVAMAPLGSWERKLVNVKHYLGFTPCKFDGLHWKDVYRANGLVDKDKQELFDRDMLLGLIAKSSKNSKKIIEIIVNKKLEWKDITPREMNRDSGLKQVLLVSKKESRLCSFTSSFWLSDKDQAWFPRSLGKLKQNVYTSNSLSAELVNQLGSSSDTSDSKVDNSENNLLLQKILGLDLSERSFRFIDFSGKWLPKANLKKTQWQYANLSEVKLPNTDLRWANLQSADLSKANLQSADLRKANLQSADLSKAILQSADLRWANLQSVDLSETNLQRFDLRETNLQSVDLRETNLQSADLSGANLQSAYLWSANLQSADLRWAILQSADLSEANLQSADLSLANLQSADLSLANLQSADLSLANLQSADLSEANLQSANLNEANLTGSIHFSSKLYKTDITLADLTNTVWRTGKSPQQSEEYFIGSAKNTDNLMVIGADNYNQQLKQQLYGNSSPSDQDHLPQWIATTKQLTCNLSSKNSYWPTRPKTIKKSIAHNLDLASSIDSAIKQAAVESTNNNSQIEVVDNRPYYNGLKKALFQAANDKSCEHKEIIGDWLNNAFPEE